jgi:hypothetical protein
MNMLRLALLVLSRAIYIVTSFPWKPNAKINSFNYYKTAISFLHRRHFCNCWLKRNNSYLMLLWIVITHSLTHSLTHGAEPFLRSCQLCSYWIASQRFMEPEGSLPCSQEPSTGLHSEPDQSNPYHPILSEIHFNTVHPPTSWSSQWSLSFWYSHQYPICSPRATCPANLILLVNLHTQVNV